MNVLRSEYLSRRLYGAMSVIILCLLLICIPLIVHSVQGYTQSRIAYQHIQALRDVADLANKISRERGPANKLMLSTPDHFEEHKGELEEHRHNVDRQLAYTVMVLKDSGFPALSEQIQHVLQPSLAAGRQHVDTYAHLPYTQRSATELDASIVAMYRIWDDCRDILQAIVMEAGLSSTQLNRFMSQILILADLRDQAGRAVSNVTAPVTFETPMPKTNLARTLQTIYQVRYLWNLVNTIQPMQARTAEFSFLHTEIEKYYLKDGLSTVAQLLEESDQQRPYHLTGLELTEVMGDKFAKVVDLQTYLLQYSYDLAKREMRDNLNRLLLMLIISLISLAAAVSTMIYARKRVFLPLIHARDMLFELSQSAQHADMELDPKHTQSVDTLFDAIKRLQHMLQQREAFEFKLKNLANTDPLTGVANRLALSEYVKLLDTQQTKCSETCLMVVDIDYFKQVNDQHGHILGDRVIQWVAETLKKNVRNTDLLVRYGGDEFLVLIEHIQLNQALQIAEKIRVEVAAAEFIGAQQERIAVSVSIGVAVGANSWLSLLEKSDQALFRAKAKGRNAVSS